jgi:hypothetical protein
VAAGQRWNWGVAASDTESSANAGSNMALYRYSDTGTYLGMPLFVNRANGNLVTENHLGIASTPPPMHASRFGIRISDAGLLFGGPGYNALEVRCNSYQDTSNVARAMLAGTGGSLALVNDTLAYSNAPSVGAGATQTFAPRMAIGATGQMALTPNAGVAAVSIGGTAQPKISVQSGAPSSPMTGDLWVW